MKYIVGFFRGVWNFLVLMAEGRQRYLERQRTSGMY